MLPSESFALCIKGKVANLRKEPKVSSKDIWAVRKFMPLKEISRTSKWVYVEDLEGDQHYVSVNSVTNKTQCMVVNVNVAKAYRGPGENYGLSPFNNFDRYTPFQLIGRKGSWYEGKNQKGGHYWFRGSDIWLP